MPIIINEYCWLWLNRDGSPTCLTDKVYESILGMNSTTEQRRQIHARYVAALTEFWRCQRKCAGVLHFCGLGYPRAGDRPRPKEERPVITGSTWNISSSSRPSRSTFGTLSAPWG